MKVIAVDPGETTGLVVCPDVADVDTWTVQELPWELAQDAVWEELELSSAANERVHLVVERYTITVRTLKLTRQYAALYTIGAVLLMARRFGCQLTLQTPAEAAGFATDTKLNRDAGRWRRAGGSP